MLTKEELAALPPKAKRDATLLELYREHEYLTAYALHTDRRVAREGHEVAAGADASRDNWDSHGNLQRDFLLSQGLLPGHRLLDIGCGAGRLARKVCPILEPGQYHGVDLSAAALSAARRLADTEGWAMYAPCFWLKSVPGSVGGFMFIWAHSVFTHLPPEMIEAVMRDAAGRLAQDGRFYWSYMPSETTERYGLTQYRATLDVYVGCAHRAGLTFEVVPDWVRSAGHEPGRWSYGQNVAVSRRA